MPEHAAYSQSPDFTLARPDRPALSQRLRTLWHRTELDHQLAQGVDPATSDELEHLDGGVSLRHAVRSARLALDAVGAQVYRLASGA